MSEPTTPDLVGRRFGLYEVQALVGAGGMGVVYRALDTNLNRPVAIKFLPDDFANPAARHRFEREARTVSSLNHPHILTVHDANQFEGRQYLVTEFIDGGTFRDWMREAKRDWRQVVDLLIGVADGLAAAHQAGILHRDIKPENILITKSGYAKLADFGLAKLHDHPAPETTPTRTELSTRAGVVVGTTAYLSPEQALGRPVDARSDIFAFGVLLFEALAGSRPFTGASDLDVLQAIARGSPPPMPDDVPLRLRMIVEKTLEKDPADRFQSMRDVVVDLRRVSRQTTETELPGTRSNRALTWLAGFATLALVLGGAGVLFFSRDRAPTRLEYTQLTNFADSVVSPALSPDGRFLSFIRSDETFLGFGEVYVKLLPDGEPVQLTRDGQRKVGPAVFSPDGSRIAYTVAVNRDYDWDTWSAPVLGGQPTRMLANATALTWIGADGGPPGVLFAEWTDTPPRMALFTASERRVNQQRIYLPDDVNGMVHRAYLSPDGRWVLMIEMDASGWVPCRVLPRDGSSRGKQVGPSPGQCTDAAWSPDGRWMYFSASTGKGFHIWRQRFAGGEPEQMTSGASEEEGVTVAPDGRSIVTSVGTSQTTLWLHDSRGERQITAQGNPAVASFSSDGQTVYYLSSPVSHNFVSGKGELWAANIETGKLERLLPELQMEHYSVSPDGNKVAFVRDEGGRSTVWLATLDGRSAPRRLSSLDSITCVFGPKGEVFFVGGEGTLNFLHRIKDDGTGLQKVTPDPVKVLYDVSPDGKWAAVWAGRAVVAYPTAGGDPIVICPACANRAPPDQPVLVTWARDGSFVYLHEAGPRQTYAVPLKDGEMLPALPASGLMSPSAATTLPGVRMIAQERAFGGPNPSVYAFVRVTTHRNIYRIPVQ
jgi:eukaryotic-like serine/threonine-protein kinase